MCACGSPGAGRNHVTPRYYRHFNIINYVELSAESMQLIFSTVLMNFLSTFEDCVSNLTEGIVGASIDVYNAVLDTLKPTPSKPHYTFNMRDVSKVYTSTSSSFLLLPLTSSSSLDSNLILPMVKKIMIVSSSVCHACFFTTDPFLFL